MLFHVVDFIDVHWQPITFGIEKLDARWDVTVSAVVAGDCPVEFFLGHDCRAQGAMSTALAAIERVVEAVFHIVVVFCLSCSALVGCAAPGESFGDNAEEVVFPSSFHAVLPENVNFAVLKDFIHCSGSKPILSLERGSNFGADCDFHDVVVLLFR